MFPILSIMIFLPIIVTTFLFVSRSNIQVIKLLALLTSLIVFVLATYLFINFEAISALQFVEKYPWIEQYGITYHIGVDGYNLMIVMAIAVLMPLVYLALWNREEKGYWYNLLLVQAGVMGAAVSFDLILFYLFWETMLLPIFFIMGLYGYEDKIYSTMKFTLYTLLGSLLMLVSILYLAVTYYNLNGEWSFLLNDLKALPLTTEEIFWVFGGFILAFGIKIPLFPFHTWLPGAYATAPSGAVVVLSSIMAKIGVYAIWRFLFFLFPQMLGSYAPYLLTLALLGLIYFGVGAIMQRNIKRMFAYSSGSHLSLILVGLVLLNPYGWNGSIYLIGAHALSSGGLFLMVAMLYARTKNKDVNELGGIASQAPLFTLFFVFFSLAIVGIPGTSGFVAELLIILGAFEHSLLVGVIAASTLLLAMTFIFWMLQRVLFGETQESTENFYDLKKNELAALIPLALLILVMGIMPQPFIEKFQPTVTDNLKLEMMYIKEAQK